MAASQPHTRGKRLLTMTALARLKSRLGDVETRRFLRFLCVGVLNTAFGYSLFAGIFLLSGSHSIAITVATIVGALFNYISTGRLVFNNSGLQALIPFVLGYAVILALNFVLVEILVRSGVHALAAQAISLPVLVLTSYVINARMVFRRRAAADDPTTRDGRN